jgi:creatinine amidohydrolase
VLIFINNTIVTSLTFSGGKMQTTDKLKTVVGAVACAVTLFAQVDGASGHGPAAKNTLPRPGVYRIEELTAPEVDRMDRNKTLFILPVGMLEEHGPHLPIGSDTYQVDFIVDRTIKRLQRTLPDWLVVVLPTINYGEGGANGFSGNPVHPGTYGIRYTTLRSILADVGGQIAHNKFKWIFVIHGHGAPMHNVAINDACDFVSQTFSVTMLNITSLRCVDAEFSAKSDQSAAKYFSAKELQAQGLDIHAGTRETSAMLAVAPQRVRSLYSRLPDRSGKTIDELASIAEKPGWEGYFGSPAQASSAFGKKSIWPSKETQTSSCVRCTGKTSPSTLVIRKVLCLPPLQSRKRSEPSLPG